MHIKICQCWNLSDSRIEEIFIETLCSCKTTENRVDGDMQHDGNIHLLKLVVGHNRSAHGQNWRLWIKCSLWIEKAHGVTENALHLGEQTGYMHHPKGQAPWSEPGTMVQTSLSAKWVRTWSLRFIKDIEKTPAPLRYEGPKS